MTTHRRLRLYLPKQQLKLRVRDPQLRKAELRRYFFIYISTFRDNKKHSLNDYMLFKDVIVQAFYTPVFTPPSTPLDVLYEILNK